MTRLVLFTRYPEAGRAKTRLIPALGAEGAARVHKVLTERTVALLPGAEVHFTGANADAFKGWLGDGFTYVEQPAGDLTDRLLAALEISVFASEARQSRLCAGDTGLLGFCEAEVYPERLQGSRRARNDESKRPRQTRDFAPVIFFGADTPDLTVAHVTSAIEALKTNEVVIGPAEDGGYYLIGVAGPLTSLFTDMEWSTPRVLPETLARLAAMNIEPVMLETLADCDRPEDVARWPWLTA